MSQFTRFLMLAGLVWVGCLSAQPAVAAGATGEADSDLQPAASAPQSIPREVRFGGVLQDAAGSPLAGVQGVTFALYREQEGGAPLWLQTQNVAADEQGRYSALLGAMRADGLPQEVFTSNEARWLGVRVNQPGTEEQARVLLVSVPYALKAADAETLGGQPLSSFVLSTDALATRVGKSGGLTGAAASDGLPTAALDGTGTGGKIVKWADSDSLGDSVLAEDSGRIGLNNSTPTTSLDVSGTIRAVLGSGAPFGTYLMPTGGAANSFRFGFGNNLFFDGTDWRTKGDGANNAGSGILTNIGAGALSIFTLPSTGAADQVISNASFNSFEKLRISADGNVGIGTSSPTQKLEVVGNILSSGTVTATAFAGDGSALTNLPASGVSGSGTTNFVPKFTAASTLGDSLIFDSGSGVGIGTSSPAGKLHVAGNVTVTVGNLTLPATAVDGSTGVLTIEGTRILHSANSATNLFLGQAAGSFATGGVDNTALGSSAMGGSTTGNFNTAVGPNTLFSNSGSGNTAVGALALDVNTSGSNNTAVGQNALGAVTTNGNNTAVGVSALLVNTAAGNTAVGANAMDANTTGTNNTAVGNNALGANASSSNNTAVGINALAASTGSGNTAVGTNSLDVNSTGTNNTAVGNNALGAITTSSNSTAVGTSALATNTSADNTAVGANALDSNGSGTNNTAVGRSALAANTGSSNSTAIGSNALVLSTGASNTALGALALDANVGGSRNTAVGHDALGANTTGSDNIAIGYQAGNLATTGNANIYIGHNGVPGESNAIRIGLISSTKTYIDGIVGQTTGVADAVGVVIDSAGQLGTINSSARFKEDIRDMGEASRRLMQLGPVVFRYKKPMANGTKPLQFGLIAEEVANVFPELVVYDKEGQPTMVFYHVLPSLLLNELQRQEAKMLAQETDLAALRTEVTTLRAALDEQSRQQEQLRKLQSALEGLKARLGVEVSATHH